MKRKDRLKYHLYLALLYPVALLPLRLLYIASDIIAFMMRRMMRYRRKVVRDNLASCFPEKSHAERAAIEKEFYRSLADNIVETVKLLSISHRAMRRRVVVTNGHLVDEIAATGRPIILYLGHFGNWEWMPAMTYYYSSAILNGHIYKKMHDPAADAVMHRIRSRFPSQGIELKRALREILAMGRKGAPMMVGFISDHRFNNVQRRHSTMFLNHETPYYVGGEAIGSKIGAEFLYLDVEKTGRGHYRLTFVPITPDPAVENSVTIKYMELMEATIRRQPPYWLWSHRRWLPKPSKDIPS